MAKKKKKARVAPGRKKSKQKVVGRTKSVRLADLAELSGGRFGHGNVVEFLDGDPRGGRPRRIEIHLDGSPKGSRVRMVPAFLDGSPRGARPGRLVVALDGDPRASRGRLIPAFLDGDPRAARPAPVERQRRRAGKNGPRRKK